MDEFSHRPLVRLGVFTHIFPTPKGKTFGQTMEMIEQNVRDLDVFRPGRLPISIAGSRAVSVPLLHCAASVYNELGTLQFDARPRLCDPNTEPCANEDDCSMRRALDVVNELVQVGVRAITEGEYRDFPKRIGTIITPEQIEDDIESSVEKILFGLPKDVYLTVDMSAFDPSCAPGVFIPEPGGLRWRQVIKIIENVVAAKNLIGMDVVGIRPLGYGNIVTEYAAARLIGKVINIVSAKKAF